jgi:hypothetical protein
MLLQLHVSLAVLCDEMVPLACVREDTVTLRGDDVRPDDVQSVDIGVVGGCVCVC